jgi:hypothetical protein
MECDECEKMTSEEYEALISTVVSGMTNKYDLIKYGGTKQGRSNLWKGISGFDHQIDVSYENETDVLLVECKHWKGNVPAETFLTLWARVIDIESGQESKGRKFRGALVVSKGFQDGVIKLAKHYEKKLVFFACRLIGVLILYLMQSF